MNTGIFRAARVLAPSDLRLIWRDGFLMHLVLFVLPLVAWGSHTAIPWIGELVVEWIYLEDYYGLILAGLFVAGQPMLMAFVFGILFVEERDEGTLLALQASPLSLRGFLAYRLLIAGIASIVLTIVAILLANLVTISWLALVVSVVLASLSIPVVVLVYAVYVKNKVQALMLGKLVQAWGSLPAFLFFAPPALELIGSILMPLYFPIRFFWEASNGEPAWWLLIPGVSIPAIETLWLFRRFEQRVSR